MSELIDNKSHRIRSLKEIIQHLHAGKAPEQVKARLREIVGQTEATEIMAMEQELMSEGMPVEEVRSMCDLHSQVTREVLVQLPVTKAIEPGHPVDTFKRENEALRSAADQARHALGQLRSSPENAEATSIVLKLHQAFNDLMDVEKHYQRKEHALFSCLERHGITGPSKVMWAKDDEVRDLLKSFGTKLQETSTAAGAARSSIATAAEVAIGAVLEMIYKEENILLPMALSTLSEDEWGEIWSVSPQYGWCLVEPRQGYKPPVGEQAETVSVPSSIGITLPTGHVSPEQLAALCSTLPLDLTCVDADDRVAFFSEGPDRIFARSKAIIGRKVQHCHPPRSVEIVDQILADFKAGHQDVAEFWIDFHGKLVHIRYFAVRSEVGEYLGTVELTQDLAPLRRLQGERRLLQYAESQA
jgi:DUF438 domain-containing protein